MRASPGWGGPLSIASAAGRRAEAWTQLWYARRMKPEASILLLGAYGLAGRAILDRLLRTTPYRVIAAGRDLARLGPLLSGHGPARATALALDVTNSGALREACEGASLVINATGPYAQHGADVARAAVESGCAYVDCANEQAHYQRLLPLNQLALDAGVPIITAAGVIPGISTLLVAHLLREASTADVVEVSWAQYRHAYAETGLASVMGGILEAAGSPRSLREGVLQPVVIGRAVRTMELPAPFGTTSMLEVPTIDVLTLSANRPLREFRVWFYLGDMPTWLLGLVRVLQPQRRAWAYRLIAALMRRVNDHDTARAIARGIGPEALLHIEVSGGGPSRSVFVRFCDGAAPTACLPVYLADQYLQGLLHKTGLLTPIDLLSFTDIEPALAETVIESDLRSPPRA